MQKHHIVPRHAGGTDDPSNLVELTVAEHAEEHRKLFEKYGRWQDEVAWKALSGQITGEEAARLARRNAQLGRKDYIGEGNPRYGDHRTYEEILGKARAAKVKAHRSKINAGRNNPMFGKKRPDVAARNRMRVKHV